MPDAPFDWVFYLFISINVGAAGIYTLYGPNPNSALSGPQLWLAERGAAWTMERAHSVMLVVLNAIMAIMLTSVINPFIVMLFLFAMSTADLIAEMRPQWFVYLSQNLFLHHKCKNVFFTYIHIYILACAHLVLIFHLVVI
jgi:hypothetical protein